MLSAQLSETENTTHQKLQTEWIRLVAGCVADAGEPINSTLLQS